MREISQILEGITIKNVKTNIIGSDFVGLNCVVFIDNKQVCIFNDDGYEPSFNGRHSAPKMLVDYLNSKNFK